MPDISELSTPAEELRSGEAVATGNGPGTGEAARTGDEQTAALQAELEACLAAGLTPDGWKYQISWSQDSGSHRMNAMVTIAFIAGSAVACGITWGWKAGLAAALTAGGLRMLLSVRRGGPRLGQTITESFIPPDVTLREVGIAGHKVFDVTASSPVFSRTRVATRADLRDTRLGTLLLAAGFILAGTLTLLEESRVITPIAYLRVTSLIGAALSVGLAIWAWRRIGKWVPLLDPQRRASARSLGAEVLDTATTGASATKAVASGLLSRLPLKVYRVVLPCLMVTWGALGVLAAFTITPPHQSQMWPDLAAAADLTAFALAGVHALILMVLGVLGRDWGKLKSAVGTVALMAVLLLIAKLFGWLDNWGAVISWVWGQIR